MTISVAPTADIFLQLLGLRADDPRVQANLAQFAHGMQPELDPDDEDILVDWVLVKEIGLEYGFEDEAFVRALAPSGRRNGPLILSQLYFYGDTDNTRPFPFPLPFGLSFEDDRTTVQRKLMAHNNVLRSYVRDFWALEAFNFVVEYTRASKLDAVYCYLPYTPWPKPIGEAAFVARFTPQRFQRLFGRRWSSTELRTELAPFDYEAALPEVRTAHTADFSFEHGLSLKFATAERVPAADQSAPATYVLAGVEFHSSRAEDSREWAGALPLNLSFSDTPKQLRDKVGEPPAEFNETWLEGTSVWHLQDFTLQVTYSTLENRLIAITMYAPGYWSTTGAPAA